MMLINLLIITHILLTHFFLFLFPFISSNFMLTNFRRGAGSSSMNFSTAGRLSTPKRGSDDSSIQDESMDGEESKLE
jgi:hypothetical protein